MMRFKFRTLRKVFLVFVPIALLAIYFGLLNIQKRSSENAKLNTSQSVQAEPPNTREPAACGAVLKLDKNGFAKLRLFEKLAGIVTDSGFTEEDVKEMSSALDVQEQAFSAYSLGYLTWEKSEELSRADYDKRVLGVIATFQSKSQNLSAQEKVELDEFMAKFKRMVSKAFDLGRHDSKLSPCPF